ncbi:hypothetical protein RclHR1_13390003 [Rhizophagus clarus]|uniref:RNase H type-1 domain-containing protein n=1 Tax=Rhizophagus clarus TaxID=94130 RepID=A0A2Z6QQA9_9GLOM|nr:hypothetical protein RclHR1_13390003 [Rhizophagus clarus]GES93717.1 hypothetical protein RCL_jg27198.t1 [Rhizophagus clarus]
MNYCLIPVDINTHIQQIVNNTPSHFNHLDNTINYTTPFKRDQTIDKFLQHFEYNTKAEALFIIQQHLMDKDNLVFFTDGLLINANTQAASMTAGFIRISESNNIIHTFTSTVENWPSSLRAELFAILLTLIVSLNRC